MSYSNSSMVPIWTVKIEFESPNQKLSFNRALLGTSNLRGLSNPPPTPCSSPRAHTETWLSVCIQPRAIASSVSGKALRQHDSLGTPPPNNLPHLHRPPRQFPSPGGVLFPKSLTSTSLSGYLHDEFSPQRHPSLAWPPLPSSVSPFPRWHAPCPDLASVSGSALPLHGHGSCSLGSSATSSRAPASPYSLPR